MACRPGNTGALARLDRFWSEMGWDAGITPREPYPFIEFRLLRIEISPKFPTATVTFPLFRDSLQGWNDFWRCFRVTGIFTITLTVFL